jgi:hypothetical protein
MSELQVMFLSKNGTKWTSNRRFQIDANEVDLALMRQERERVPSSLFTNINQSHSHDRKREEGRTTANVGRKVHILQKDVYPRPIRFSLVSKLEEEWTNHQQATD